MESCFLAGIGVKEKALLQQNGIDAFDMDLDGRQGIIIAEEMLQRTIDILGWAHKGGKTTRYEGVIEAVAGPRTEELEGPPEPVKLPEPPKPARIFTATAASGWKGQVNAGSFIRPIQQILLPVIGPAVHKDIVLTSPHVSLAPCADGKFYVHIFSSAANGIKATTPTEIFGERAFHIDHRSFGASGLGVPILSGDYEAAELVGDNLYIHHDLAMCDKGEHWPSALRIFEKILREAVKLLAFPPEKLATMAEEIRKEKEAREAERKRQERLKMRETYISACSKRIAAQISECQRVVSDCNRNFLNFQNGLIDAARNLSEKQEIVAILAASRQALIEKCVSTVGKLLAVCFEIAHSAPVSDAEAERQKKRQQDQYSQMIDNEIQQHKSVAKSAQDTMENRRKSFDQNLKTLMVAEAQLAVLGAAGGDRNERYGKEFDNLFNLHKVIDTKIEGECLLVFTDTLFCKDPRTNTIHEIGQFKIVIPINGNYDLRWYNLTRQVNGMQAPHVNKDGGACLGNIKQAVVDLFAGYEFSTLAMLAIQFIQTVNVDDNWGQHIGDWPTAKTEDAK